MTTSTVVYSTSTGEQPSGSFVSDPEFTGHSTGSGPGSVSMEIEWPAFCFVCSRVTEHFGEHDDLLAAGLVSYAEDGSVHKTEAWTDEAAAAVRHATDIANGWA